MPYVAVDVDTDYCTDGTTVTSYPGDPAIDSNFDKPNAPPAQAPRSQEQPAPSAPDQPAPPPEGSEK